MSHNHNRHHGNGNGNNGSINISKDVLEFAKIDFKKFKKKYKKEYYDYDVDKDELRREYKEYLLERFPAVINFLVRYGYIDQEDVQNTKMACYEKINTEEFIKMVKKSIKNDYEIENIDLLPIVIGDFIHAANRWNKERTTEDPNAAVDDLSSLIELSQLVMGKKMKKLEKAGCKRALAFDVLSIIPCKEAMKISKNYRIHSLYECLYSHAKTDGVDTIPFEEIMDKVVKDDMVPMAVVFSMLERKEKFSKMDDSQKALYVKITDWCLKELTSFDNHVLKQSLTAYANTRKKDDQQGKDSNRRYSLSSLPEYTIDDDGRKVNYENIKKMINVISSDNPSLEKYFK